MTHLLFSTILFCSSAACFSQADLKYDSGSAEKLLLQSFFSEGFWMMPSRKDDRFVFSRKSDAKKEARIRPIPVFKLLEGKVIRFAIDSSLVAGFLFRRDSLICPLYLKAYIDRRGKKKSYMAIGEDLSPALIELLLENYQLWFYLTSTSEFVMLNGSRYYSWSDEASSLSDITEDLYSMRGVFDRGKTTTGVDTLGSEKESDYMITRAEYGGRVTVFRNVNESFEFGREISGPKVKNELLRISVNAGSENYFLELHQAFEWFSLTVEGKVFITYVNAPFTDSKNSELRFSELNGYSKQLVEVNVKKLRKDMIEFVTVIGNDTLLTAEWLGDGDKVVIREHVQSIINPRILRLAAITLFWSERFEKK